MAKSTDSGTNQERRRYVTQLIKDIADVETVAECLGLQTQRRGSRVSILCPCHDDQHFGSCYLTPKGFKCYACHEHGDMIKLVQKTLNCDFVEACDFIAGIYGQADDFKADNIRPMKRVLDEESLRLIGLSNTDDSGNRLGKVYVDIIIVPSNFPESKLQKGQRLKWVPLPNYEDCGSIFDDRPPNTSPDGYYVLQELITSNPLQELLNEDEKAYKELICRKATEAADKYRRLIDMAQNPAKFYIPDDISDFMLAHQCSLITDETGFGLWKAEMEKKIRQCDNIRIEFSESPKKEKSKNPKEESFGKKRSIFGKIKGGGVSI